MEPGRTRNLAHVKFAQRFLQLGQTVVFSGTVNLSVPASQCFTGLDTPS
jgi:hypothetical protein